MPRYFLSVHVTSPLLSWTDSQLWKRHYIGRGIPNIITICKWLFKKIQDNSLFPDIAKVVERLKTRDSTEIIGLILQAVEHQPLTRSKIMYLALFNFKQVTDYTGMLTDEGLLSYLVENRKFAITNRGKQFLELFKETNKLLTTRYDDMTANSQVQDQQYQVTLHE